MLISHEIRLKGKTTKDKEGCDILTNVTIEQESLVIMNINPPDGISVIYTKWSPYITDRAVGGKG